MLMPRHLATGSATAAQLRMVTFRIHRRVALAGVERYSFVVIYRKVMMPIQQNLPDLWLHKAARCGGGR
jgi:hypothetical protein